MDIRQIKIKDRTLERVVHLRTRAEGWFARLKKFYCAYLP